MSDVKQPEVKKVEIAPFKPEERTPSNWLFDPESDDDTIIAYNRVTGRSFKGPRSDFKALMRG